MKKCLERKQELNKRRPEGSTPHVKLNYGQQEPSEGQQDRGQSQKAETRKDFKMKRMNTG